MKNRTLIIVLVIAGILVLSGYAIFKLYRMNQQAKANMPYLLIGEHVEYFDLLDEDANPISASTLEKDRPSIILIFSRPCSPCNKNIVYWRKIAEVLEKDVDIYGIVLGSASEAFNFAEEAKLNFKIYVPEDLEKFIKKQRIMLNFGQTILYTADNGVNYLKMGPLEGDEAVSIINMAKKMI